MKRFLKTIQDTLVMDQFCAKESLPQAQGADTVRFFCEPSGNAADVIALAQDTIENSTFSTNDLTHVDVQLGFFGDKQRISNRLSLTSFFDRVKSSTRKMGLSAALYCDNLIRNAAVTEQDLAGHKRYSGAAANFNALVALSAANGSWHPVLAGLAAVTQLKTKKATPMAGGDFIHVVPPEIAYDLMQHAKWEEPSKYAGSKQIFKGELGRLYGARYVEHTNPFREASTDDTEGTFAAAGAIFSVLTLGEEALGFVDLAGTTSPMKPTVAILDKAEKADPHNQMTVVAYAAYAAAKALAKQRYVVTRCKSTFA